MRNFVNLNDAIKSMATDSSTATQPIKRMFVADGDFVSANVSILEEPDDALHTQESHDEIVVVLEGDVEFRVCDQTRRVGPGDFIFIPRNTGTGRSSKRASGSHPSLCSPRSSTTASRTSTGSATRREGLVCERAAQRAFLAANRQLAMSSPVQFAWVAVGRHTVPAGLDTASAVTDC